MDYVFIRQMLLYAMQRLHNPTHKMISHAQQLGRLVDPVHSQGSDHFVLSKVLQKKTRKSTLLSIYPWTIFPAIEVSSFCFFPKIKRRKDGASLEKKNKSATALFTNR